MIDTFKPRPLTNFDPNLSYKKNGHLVKEHKSSRCNTNIVSKIFGFIPKTIHFLLPNVISNKSLHTRSVSKSEKVEAKIFSLIKNPPRNDRKLKIFRACINDRQWFWELSKFFLEALNLEAPNKNKTLTFELITKITNHIQIQYLNNDNVSDSYIMMFTALERLKSVKVFQTLTNLISRFDGDKDKQLGLIYNSITPPYQLPMEGSCFATAELMILYHNSPKKWIRFAAHLIEYNEADFNLFRKNFNFPPKNELIIDVSQYGYKDKGKPGEFYQKALSAIASFAANEEKQRMANAIRYVLYYTAGWSNSNFKNFLLRANFKIHSVTDSILNKTLGIFGKLFGFRIPLPDGRELESKDLIPLENLNFEQISPADMEKLKIDVISETLSKVLVWSYGTWTPSISASEIISTNEKMIQFVNDCVKKALDTKFLEKEITNLEEEYQMLSAKGKEVEVGQILGQIIRSTYLKEFLSKGKVPNSKWTTEITKIMQKFPQMSGGEWTSILHAIFGSTEEDKVELYDKIEEACFGVFSKISIKAMGKFFNELSEKYSIKRGSLIPISVDFQSEMAPGHVATLKFDKDCMQKLTPKKKIMIGYSNWDQKQCIYMKKVNNEYVQLCYSNGLPIWPGKLNLITAYPVS